MDFGACNGFNFYNVFAFWIKEFQHFCLKVNFIFYSELCYTTTCMLCCQYCYIIVYMYILRSYHTYVKVLPSAYIYKYVCFKESQKEFTIFRVQANFLRDATIVLLRVAAFRRIFGDAAQLLPPPDSPPSPPHPDLPTTQQQYTHKRVLLVLQIS